VTEYWKVLEKKAVKVDDGHQLVLVCERHGKKRDAVVSGVTWEAAVIGETVELMPVLQGRG
jgi:hypothetical protein